MITERDLLEAIAECQGVKNPNANTCIKLAAYYTILNNLNEPPVYSMTSGASSGTTVSYDGDSDFAKAVYGMDYNDFMPIMDELMKALEVVNPRLYDSVMRKLQ